MPGSLLESMGGSVLESAEVLGGVSRTATVEEAEIRSSMRHLFAGRTAAVQFKEELE